MVITAQRMETKDLKTPAAVEVVTKEKIENSGAGSAYDVLQNALGIMSSAQGPNGAAMGSMTSKIIVRGVDKGTLVMVDGVPMNQDGKYNLEDIPSEMIEKIEIVRGGGSVLYGTGFLYFVSNDIVTPKSCSAPFLYAHNALNPISSSIAVINPPCTLPG